MLSIIFLFFKKLNIFSKRVTFSQRRSCLKLWQNIIFGSVSAAIIGFTFKDIIHKYFYNGFVVALMLVLYGVFFLLVENSCSKSFKINKLDRLDFKNVFLIGVFQTLALIPGIFSF